MFIFSLSKILANCKKKKKQTSDKYTRFQKTVLLFQISQKIAIKKAFLYINCSLHLIRSRSANPSQGKNHKKRKEKMKEKEKMKKKEKKKRNEKKKRGEERYNGGSGT